MSASALRKLCFAFAGLLLVLVGVRFAFGRMFRTGGAPAYAVEKTVVSRDGATIAYEQTGSGPVVILVSAALSDRDGARPLARHLSSGFTVLNYDRRGRGRSSTKQPYAVEREVEDVAALVQAAGGNVYLFGSSSGAVLALDAAQQLGARVTRLFLYEPPLIVDSSRAPVPAGLTAEIQTALAANDRDQAVALFFGKGMGIPGPGVTFMRWMLPAWSDMLRLAHTIPYDLQILAGTQTGQPLPSDRWAQVSAPALVAAGSKGEPFFHTGAQALAAKLPAARYSALEGLDHSAVLMAPEPLAAAVREFFRP